MDTVIPTIPIASNLSVDAAGHLCFAGVDTALLAKEYGTPLYLMDEDRVRENCRVYTEAFRKCFRAGSRVLYASKANAFKHMYEIAGEEGLGVDVVSSGEIYTAVRAGTDPEGIFFHSNNKTDADIAFAMDNGVGRFVADGAEEVLAVEAEAAKRGIRQKLLLRLTPGIDTHTYAAVNTGLVDSKFGAAIETGQAEELTALTLKQPHIELTGFHCHVGSEVFAEDVFERSAVIMLRFIAHIRKTYGFVCRELDLGGGYGVRYVDTDPYVDIAAKIASVAETVRTNCAALGLEEPCVFMEPGRSIVADAGLTLYTVGAVKRIPGYKNYVSVDGGMGDNPRYALYQARYTCLPADRMTEPRTLKADLVGRFCESGDVLEPGIVFPETVCRGDLVAVCTTGAYNYSMASNYNRVPRPAVVMLKGGRSFTAVRRETFDDLIRLDV